MSVWFQHIETGPFLRRHLFRHFPGAKSQAGLFTFIMTWFPLNRPGRAQRWSHWSLRERAADSKIQTLDLSTTTQGLFWDAQPSFSPFGREDTLADFFHRQLLCRLGGARGSWRCRWPETTVLVRILANTSTWKEVFLQLLVSTACFPRAAQRLLSSAL